MEPDYRFLKPPGYKYKIGQRADPGDYNVCLNLIKDGTTEQKFYGEGSSPYEAIREASKRAREFFTSNGNCLSPNKDQRMLVGKFSQLKPGKVNKLKLRKASRENSSLPNEIHFKVEVKKESIQSEDWEPEGSAGIKTEMVGIKSEPTDVKCEGSNSNIR
eukprot:GFUD01123143.1.p1 GENE.GFUD01123143.1~~GFUD01123143.1.p1  ORF type:complete len:160 (+),score=33.49 GFUD01123143.1:1-480(+)